MGGWSFGTLLGPEITGPVVSGSFCGGLVWLVLLFLVSRAWPKLRTGSSILLGVGVVWVVGVMGLLFGNCIVDASIL